MAKVLIVDDDEDLRGIVKEVLSDEGFSPTEASDGLRAIEVLPHPQNLWAVSGSGKSPNV